MNSFYIIFQNNLNQLSVVTPVLNEALSLEQVIEKCVPKNTSYKVVDTLDIDSVFFNAYEFDPELGAKANISKAKEIWRDNFRRARRPLLEALDVEYMRADEAGNTSLKTEIASQKQALRDVTNISLPNTLEGIKSTWPSILGENPYYTVTPTETPTETLTQTPTESPTESLSETPTETLTETLTETSSETPTESLTESPSETLTETETEN